MILSNFSWKIKGCAAVLLRLSFSLFSMMFDMMVSCIFVNGISDSSIMDFNRSLKVFIVFSFFVFRFECYFGLGFIGTNLCKNYWANSLLMRDNGISSASTYKNWRLSLSDLSQILMYSFQKFLIGFSDWHEDEAPIVQFGAYSCHIWF